MLHISCTDNCILQPGSYRGYPTKRAQSAMRNYDKLCVCVRVCVCVCGGAYCELKDTFFSITFKNIVWYVSDDAFHCVEKPLQE